MNLANATGEKILGIPLEEIPERCRECPVLHEFAAKYPELDLTQLPFYPDPSTRNLKAARIILSHMGNMCPRSVIESSDCNLHA